MKLVVVSTPPSTKTLDPPDTKYGSETVAPRETVPATNSTKILFDEVKPDAVPLITPLTSKVVEGEVVPIPTEPAIGCKDKFLDPPLSV